MPTKHDKLHRLDRKHSYAHSRIGPENGKINYGAHLSRSLSPAQPRFLHRGRRRSRDQQSDVNTPLLITIFQQLKPVLKSAGEQFFKQM
jgi:hypothetical protein